MMTSERKRISVLNRIEELREINSDEKKITYHLNIRFNTNRPNPREEVNILLRLESKKFIKIMHPRHVYDDGAVSTAERKTVDILLGANQLEIDILNNFSYKLFFINNFMFKSLNWKNTNIFWIIFILLKSLFIFIKHITLRFKLLSIIIGLTASIMTIISYFK
jgi:hypothetical protein